MPIAMSVGVMVCHGIAFHFRPCPVKRVTLFDQEPHASQLFKWLDGNNTSGPEPCLSFVGFIEIESSREGMLAGQQHYSL